MRPQISVITTAYNAEPFIQETIESILSQTVEELEFVVVDDGSSDRTAAIAANFPGVTVVQHPFNRGYGAALKTGMTVASRALVAWFDADNEHRVDDLVAMADRTLA